VIHLPPFQEVGEKSHYSIRDCLQVSVQPFPLEERCPLLKSQLKKKEQELGLVFMADVHVPVGSSQSWLQHN
jgi:hypothetical protein